MTTVGKRDRCQTILLGCILVFWCGCAGPSQETAGTRGPMRDKNWWNYYERGLSFLDRKDYENARADFETAMGVRRGARFGYDQDRWRELTYGLHVLEGYFPNRELGISLYHLGDLNQARSYLQRSLSQTPSGRAKHYLNRVQRDLLAGRTVPPPAIQFDTAGVRSWTREARHEVSGTAAGQGRIEEIHVHGVRQFIELAEEQFSFREKVTLTEGTNRVVVRAQDLLGQTAEATHLWVLDRQRPQLSIRSVTPDARGWLVELAFTDDRALHRVSVDGVVTFEASPDDQIRRTVVRHVAPRSNPAVTIAAQDFAGNVNQAVLRPQEVATRWSPRGYLQYASNTPAGQADTGHAALPARPPPDRLKPACRISGAGKELVSHRKDFFVDGEAEDGSGLAAIYFMGEPLLDTNHLGSVRVYFSTRMIELAEGKNTFEIEVHDTAGNVTKQALTVIYRVPETEQAEYRLSMAVPPLASNEKGQELEEGLEDHARALMENSILEYPPRFNLLERNEGLEDLLIEKSINMSDLVNDRARLAIGEFLPAELLMYSGILARGVGLIILGKVVETTDGKVLCFEDVYTEDIARDLDHKVRGLVQKVERRFPLVEGTVAVLNGETAELDVGSTNGVQLGARFVASRPEDSREFDGTLCRYEDTRIELLATDVKRTTCLARVLPSQGGGVVRVGDRALAR